MLQGIVKKGKVFAETVPAPSISDGHILIKVINSCISAGTEISNVTASNKSFVKKILEQPARVKKALSLFQTSSLTGAMEQLKVKVDNEKPTGYSAAGIVIGTGKGTTKFSIGDKAAAAGAGFANHAEYISVPENLVVKMPLDMDFVKASTVTLGGIAIQGVRRADLKLGEFAVVIGAGILGLLSVQMLKASGIRVIASDLDDRRLDLAKQLGAELTVNPAREDIIKAIENFTGGYGADAVLFTAATSSSEPLSQAFKICKKKGRVVLVGVSGMEINRGDIYAKELDFMISTSYGPGRYDRNYEEKGLDYPYAYIRWTENRNMEEYLRLVHSGHINVDSLIDKIYPIAQIEEAFDSLQREGSKPLMVILDYGEFKSGDNNRNQADGRTLKVNNFDKLDKNIVNVALIGTGSFAKNFHLPNISKLPDKFKIRAVMGRTGHTAKQLAKQYQAEYATTDYDEVLNDPNIDLVLIATRHDSHAELTLKALEKGKHVFVEKPLATNLEDVAKFEAFYADNKNSVKPLLMVGFNRRFSVYAREIKKHTEKRINPLFISYRMNAGYIPLNHWTHEENGRIVGEACHIIDLMNFLTGSQITSISFESITPANEKFSSSDNKSIVLKYADGSVCSLQYFAVGSKEYGKEFMEVHFDEKTIVLDNYKSMKGYGIKIDELQTEKEEKGQFEELSYLYESLKSGEAWPIGLSDIIQTTKASLLISIPEEECSVLNESPVEN